MNDTDLIEKKLAHIETCVRELRELAHPDDLGIDTLQTRFVEHTLQIAIQAALDVASHIVSARRLGEPETNRALFDLLGKAGLLETPLAETLGHMAAFRNILVHGYQEVDFTVVKDILENRLDDLIAFTAVIRRTIEAS